MFFTFKAYLLLIMEKTRLLKLLRTVTDKEIREFKKFARSPYFNHKTDLPLFFDYLVPYLKKGKPAPSKQAAFAKLFPTAKYDDHRMRMLISQLFQLLCKYLAVSDFTADGVAEKLRLASIFRRRNLAFHFEQTWGKLTDLHEQQPLRNADFFEKQFRISLEKYRSEYDLKQVDSQHLQALSKQLDMAFLARKLWQACFLLSHQTVSNVSYDFGMLEEALLFAEKKELLEKPAIAVYYYCYRALTQPQELVFFQKFKTLALQNDRLFPAEEMRDLYIQGINFCIRRYNAGNHEYLRDQFDFYKNGLEKNYFQVDGWLSRYTYQNAVTSALVLEELDWAENFIHAYQKQLQAPYRESVFSFNLARLEHQRKDFDKALLLLQKAEYKDLHLHLAAKTLQLKIFYELNEYDLLDAHLQAFKTFLRRKKDLGYHRENYLNTIRFTRKLLDLNPFDKNEKAVLKKEIQAAKGVGEKEWLLEQV